MIDFQRRKSVSPIGYAKSPLNKNFELTVQKTQSTAEETIEEKLERFKIIRAQEKKEEAAQYHMKI